MYSLVINIGDLILIFNFYILVPVNKGVSYCISHRQMFRTGSELDHHLETKHRFLECPVCGRQFNGVIGLRLHMGTHAPTPTHK